MRQSISIRVLAVCLASAFAYAQDDTQPERVMLRYGWVAGETRRYMLTNEFASITTGMEGQGAVRSSQEQQAVFKLRVNAVNAQNGMVSISYITESLRVKMTDINGNITTIDSSDPPSLETFPGAAPLLALVGEPIDYILLTSGEVKAVDGASIRKKVLAQLNDETSNPMMRSAVLASLSDNALKSTLSMVLGLVPAREVAIGGEWGGRFSKPTPILGNVIYDLQYTLVGIDQNDDGLTIAHIETTITASDDDEAIARTIGPGNKAALTNSSGTARIEFDVDRGEVVLSSSQIEFTFTLETTMPDQTTIATESTIVSSAVLRRLQ